MAVYEDEKSSSDVVIIGSDEVVASDIAVVLFFLPLAFLSFL